MAKAKVIQISSSAAYIKRVNEKTVAYFREVSESWDSDTHRMWELAASIFEKENGYRPDPLADHSFTDMMQFCSPIIHRGLLVQFDINGSLADPLLRRYFPQALFFATYHDMEDKLFVSRKIAEEIVDLLERNPQLSGCVLSHNLAYTKWLDEVKPLVMPRWVKHMAPNVTTFDDWAFDKWSDLYDGWRQEKTPTDILAEAVAFFDECEEDCAVFDNSDTETAQRTKALHEKMMEVHQEWKNEYAHGYACGLLESMGQSYLLPDSPSPTFYDGFHAAKKSQAAYKK